MEMVAPRLWRVRTLEPLTFEQLAGWFAYYWNRETVALSFNDGECSGVCVLKFFSRLEQMDEDYVHEPGTFAQVEAASFANRFVMWVVCSNLVRRWHPQRFVMWSRGKGDPRPRLYRWEKLARKFTYEPTRDS
jgi:hypothetical protein